MTTTAFQPAKAKLKLGSVDDKSITVEAQYNPKELQVEQGVPWQKPGAATQAGTQPASGGDDDPLALEFTGVQARTMTIEMLFDGVEESGRSVNVKEQVAILEQLARVQDPKSTDDKKRRPHFCIVTWGDRGLPSFRCVIENLTTKYSMFSSDGLPLRATCTVKLKEASRVDKEKK
ncbi:MAG: hypothetical protein SFX73_16350 [Kofleriaceae bacterium]|nr:hypothetical protein [Kofleriaceae bacterium]